MTRRSASAPGRWRRGVPTTASAGSGAGRAEPQGSRHARAPRHRPRDLHARPRPGPRPPTQPLWPRPGAPRRDAGVARASPRAPPPVTELPQSSVVPGGPADATGTGAPRSARTADSRARRPARRSGTRSGPRRDDREPRGHVPGARRHVCPHPRRPIRAPRHDDALDRGRRLREVAVAAGTGHVHARVARSDELPGVTDRKPRTGARHRTRRSRESASASQRWRGGGTAGADDRLSRTNSSDGSPRTRGSGQRTRLLSTRAQRAAPPGRRGSRGPDPPRSSGTPMPGHASSRPRTASPTGPA